MFNTLASTIVAGRGAEMNGSGVISVSNLRILQLWNNLQARSSSWLPLSVLWETTESGSQLSLSIMENLSVSPSTDPIAVIQASLTEYPLLLATYTTDSWLLCTSLTFAWKGISAMHPASLRLQNRDSASDELWLKEE